MTRIMRCLRISLLGLSLFACFDETARAQDTPVVFLHGLYSHADTWSSTAAALQQQYAVTPHLPDPDWNATFEDQASYVQQTVGSLPAGTIAIGHSNGGLVSRQWSRTHPLSAIVTVGTPHGGAPLVNHLPDWLNFNNDTIALANVVGAKLGWLNSNWWWLASTMYTLLRASGDMASVSWWQATAGIGINASIPVVREMAVGSSYLRDIANDAAREASAIPTRIAVANTTTDYRTGGPFRLTSNPTMYRNVIWGLAGTMDFYGWYLIAYSDPMDLDAQSTGWSILSLSAQFWNFEEIWCRAVSDPRPLSLGRCEDNDAIVPTWSQQFPGGITVFRASNRTHIEETAQGVDWLADAFANLLHIPARSASTGGDGAGGSGESGGGTSNQVTFYEHNAFAGGSFTAASSAEFVGWDWNDRVTSVRIPPGMSLVLYQDWYYSGQSVTLTGDVPDLRTYGGPGPDGTWNDAASSYAITGTAAGGGSGGGGMQANSAVRGCANYVERSPVFQPTASACQSYCSQNGANACEWHESGSCYVEFGTSCYVEPGYAGWSAAVLGSTSAGLNPPSSGTPTDAMRPTPGNDAPRSSAPQVAAVLLACIACLAGLTLAAALRPRVPIGPLRDWSIAMWTPVSVTLTTLVTVTIGRGIELFSRN